MKEENEVIEGEAVEVETQKQTMFYHVDGKIVNEEFKPETLSFVLFGEDQKKLAEAEFSLFQEDEEPNGIEAGFALLGFVTGFKNRVHVATEEGQKDLIASYMNDYFTELMISDWNELEHKTHEKDDIVIEIEDDSHMLCAVAKQYFNLNKNAETQH